VSSYSIQLGTAVAKQCLLERRGFVKTWDAHPDDSETVTFELTRAASRFMALAFILPLWATTAPFRSARQRPPRLPALQGRTPRSGDYRDGGEFT
jgi:hypothetical protein